MVECKMTPGSSPVSDLILTEIQRVIEDRFGEVAEQAIIDASTDVDGEMHFTITVVMSRARRAREEGNYLFGLTALLRKALGSEYAGVFPVIRPVAADAHA
ncbi:hypothetical protein FALB51S_00820 [Frigidibacter albus]|uniref:Uncharacterized protein n=2 Tax=Frigidibacter mobilis TaxID=1335048 RepID=A0A165SW82_9RHOB|nr:hypothetical protein AKL17_4599 [Frigidibacter mobilis]